MPAWIRSWRICSRLLRVRWPPSSRTPATSIVPEVGSSRKLMQRSRVRLPRPGPTEDDDDLAAVDLHVDPLQHLERARSTCGGSRRGRRRRRSRRLLGLVRSTSIARPSPPAAARAAAAAGRDELRPLAPGRGRGLAPGRSPCEILRSRRLWKNVKIDVSSPVQRRRHEQRLEAFVMFALTASCARRNSSALRHLGAEEAHERRVLHHRDELVARSAG